FWLAMSTESRWAVLRGGSIGGRHDVEVDRSREPNRFVGFRVGRAQRGFGARVCGRRQAGAQVRFEYERAASFRALPRAQSVAVAIEPTRFQSNLFRDRRFLGTFEQLDRMTRHDGRDGVLVDELGMPVASQ